MILHRKLSSYCHTLLPEFILTLAITSRHNFHISILPITIGPLWKTRLLWRANWSAVQTGVPPVWTQCCSWMLPLWQQPPVKCPTLNGSGQQKKSVLLQYRQLYWSIPNQLYHLIHRKHLYCSVSMETSPLSTFTKLYELWEMNKAINWQIHHLLHMYRTIITDQEVGLGDITLGDIKFVTCNYCMSYLLRLYVKIKKSEISVWVLVFTEKWFTNTTSLLTNQPVDMVSANMHELYKIWGPELTQIRW